ncbi:hypothetical protein NDU88_005424 [Pleurodeles waltl]|uniref:Uncharacterized protein n=1 Tax=Pleurodeles waltl TaxID=8319 RepID=A0AAV7TB86_PLEWA|nr:hypothetical protein NDU88_005424 [Pleurodeles waltl]
MSVLCYAGVIEYESYLGNCVIEGTGYYSANCMTFNNEECEEDGEGMEIIGINFLLTQDLKGPSSRKEVVGRFRLQEERGGS